MTYSMRSAGPVTGQSAAESQAGDFKKEGLRHQMMFVLGIVLFALCILLSVALHECGHMWVARATGMKVRRYFVGFGPTLWSTRRPNKLGETEYGVKAIPLGGFCDIAGMTSVDEIAPEEQPYAMYRQKTWKRAAVLAAGPAHELRHRPGAGLRASPIDLGPAQPAPAHHGARRRNRLCRSANQQRQGGRLHRSRPGGRRRASAPATSSSRSATPPSAPSTKPAPRFRRRPARPPSSTSATAKRVSAGRRRHQTQRFSRQE